MPQDPFAGVLAPVLTPFTADLAPDVPRFVALCRRLLDEGASGLAVFGTTSEANSMAADERIALLEAVLEAGIPATKLMPGTGACSLAEAARLTRHAVENGCGGVLMLPPFYYKGLGDDGLVDFFDAVIDRVGSAALRIYLYHIPQVAGVAFAPAVIDRLVLSHPKAVVGLKDSSGDFAYTRALLARHPGFAVYPGSEVPLLDGLRIGGSGCISATANVNMAAIDAVFRNAGGADAEALQARITACRKTIQAFPMIPALKAILATRLGDPEWLRVRPPFRPLEAAQSEALRAALDDAGFARLLTAIDAAAA